MHEFVSREMAALGVFGAASSAGQLVFYPALTALADGPGWRTGAWVIAGLAAALIIPVALLLRDEPSDVGTHALGETAAHRAAAAPADPGIMWRAIRSPAFRDRFALIGDEPGGGTPEDYAKYVRDELAKWGPVVKASGAKLD